jgi:hypothetical protein
MAVNRRRGSPSFQRATIAFELDPILRGCWERLQTQNREEQAIFEEALAPAASADPDVIDLIEYNGIWMTPEDANAERRKSLAAPFNNRNWS